MANPVLSDKRFTKTADELEPGWAAPTRTGASLAQTDAGLARRFDRGERVDRLLALRARAADALILDAWRRCVGDDAGAASVQHGEGDPVAVWVDADHVVDEFCKHDGGTSV